jgi:hypothetical protein
LKQSLKQIKDLKAVAEKAELRADGFKSRLAGLEKERDDAQ